MVRLFRFLAGFIIVAMAFASATLTANIAYAQSTTSTPNPSPIATTTTAGNATSGTPSPFATSSVRATIALTTTDAINETDEGDALLLPTPTPTSLGQGSALQPGSPLTTSVVAEVAAGPLEGTIIANRSESVVRFFLEGQTFQLASGQSHGIDLPRTTTVINLFNCAGDVADETPGCYWDPYLIQQDGFYEIYNTSGAANVVQLALREAGAPPTSQVWVQNRTAQAESVVFKDEVFDVQPTSVLELPVAVGVPAILYVRSCLTIDSQSACEWAPKALDAGVYYAMLEVDRPGTQAGSTRKTIDLRPVVGEVIENETDVEEAAVSQVSDTPSIVCSVVVPALNVRSGPGLAYAIIGKVRTTDGSAVTVNVTGRSIDNEWLTVDATVAPGGWINNSPSFITCNSDVLSLPIVDAPEAPVQPAIVTQPPVNDQNVPPSEQPVAVAPPESEGGESAPDGTGTAETGTEESAATDGAATIPDGQSVLVVNNGFQHEMRFTLDQMYRPIEGPSEFDLQPGESLSIIVYPGNIPFTASSPWGGLSGNASLRVEANQSIPLWLRFESEQGGNWVFRWN